MKLQDFLKEVEQKIENEILASAPPNLTSMIKYALFPTGKLIRPSLVWASAKDRNIPFSRNLVILAASIEIHHAYTLVHDDLPAMDNDEYRRGKLSHHKKFNPAMAILTGDLLMSISYKMLISINSPSLNKLYYWATGAKGLINGQVLDLQEDEKNFNQIVRIFELKTSRLFQIALLGPIYLKSEKANLREIIQSLRLGSYLGILFQIQDDFDDFNNKENLDLNIFQNYEEQAKIRQREIKVNTLKNLKNYKEVLSLFKNYFN